MAEIIVKTADLVVGQNDMVLKTGGVGSCLVVVLFDPKNKIGGLAHAMLPIKKGGFSGSDGMRGKYVDESIKNLIADIEKKGGKKENLIAKLVGGAAMFKHLINEKQSIGSQNIKVAQECLHKMDIPIESEDVGGSTGKIVEFDLASGIVNVYTKL